MKLIFFQTPLLLGLLFSSCTPFKQSPILLKVGDKTWTTKQFSKEIEDSLSGFKTSLKDEKEIKKRVSEELILKTLIENWIKKNKIKTLEPKTFKNFKEFPLFYSSKRKKLKRKFIEQNLYDTFLNSLYTSSRKISKKEKLLFYKKNKKMFFKPSACKLKQILTPTKGLAKLLRRRLLKGESFEKLAKLYSEGPEKKVGGGLGWVANGTFEVFDKACNLSKNSLSPVWESPYGFHILKVGQKREGSYEFFSKAERKIVKLIEEEQRRERFEEWLKKEIQETTVFINEKLLDQIHIRYRKTL